MKQSLYLVLVISFFLITSLSAKQEAIRVNRDKITTTIKQIKSLLEPYESRKINNKKITIMVSSTVYGLEPILNKVYTILEGLGYEVWMSHKGTLPVYSGESAFESCIRAVQEADLFLCIITPQYGSGRNNNGLSITHKELLKAVETKKLRWVLAHDHVVFARSLLANLGYPKRANRNQLNLRKGPIFGDLKVIDMYEDATLDSMPLSNRKGNWVQKYSTLEDVVTYVKAQFRDYEKIRKLLISKVNTK